MKFVEEAPAPKLGTLNTGAVGSLDDVWPLMEGLMENGSALDVFEVTAAPNVGTLKAEAVGSSDDV